MSLLKKLRRKHEVVGSPYLPDDLIVVVAQFLAGQFAFETLASLSLAKRQIRKLTLPILFETLIKPYSTSLSDYLPVYARNCHGCYVHVRYLVIEDVPQSFALDKISAEPAPLPIRPSTTENGRLRSQIGSWFRNKNPRPQPALFDNISSLFPSLELAVVTRKEKVYEGGIKTTPCDLLVFKTGTFSQLKVIMITSEDGYKRVFGRRLDGTKVMIIADGTSQWMKQGVRNIILRKDSGLMSTLANRRTDAVSYLRMILPDHLRIRVIQMPGWKPRGNVHGWIQNLRETIDCLDIVREGMAEPRTEVVASWVCLQGLMEIAGSLPTNHLLKATLHGPMDLSNEAELLSAEWQWGIQRFIQARREEHDRSPTDDGAQGIHFGISRSEDRRVHPSPDEPITTNVGTPSYSFEAQLQVLDFPFWGFVHPYDFTEIFFRSGVVFALESSGRLGDDSRMVVDFHVMWRDPRDGSEVAHALPAPIVELPNLDWWPWGTPAYIFQRSQGRAPTSN